MLVRQLQEAEKTDRKIVDPNGNWDSTRLLLKDDNMGFSFHITTIFKFLWMSQSHPIFTCKTFMVFQTCFTEPDLHLWQKYLSFLISCILVISCVQLLFGQCMYFVRDFALFIL